MKRVRCPPKIQGGFSGLLNLLYCLLSCILKINVKYNEFALLLLLRGHVGFWHKNDKMSLKNGDRVPHCPSKFTLNKAPKMKITIYRTENQGKNVIFS